MNRTLRNSISSLPYLTSTALIHPREGVLCEELFLCSGSLLRKRGSWFAVSKDLYATGSPASAAACAWHSVGRAFCTHRQGRDSPPKSQKHNTGKKKGKTSHLLLFWPLSNACLYTSVRTQKHKDQEITRLAVFVWTADCITWEKSGERRDKVKHPLWHRALNGRQLRML